jgi:hypothetical protein
MTTSSLEWFESLENAYLGAVYFVQVENSGPIKIGFTRGNPALRVASLQQASPYVLRWIGFISALPSKERELHDLFVEFRLRSEWFHPVTPILNYIESVCPNFDAKESRWKSLRFDVLKEVRSVVPQRSRQARWAFIDCLEEAGVARIDFWNWRGGSKAPDEKLLAGVQRALQIYRDTYLKEGASV